MLTIGMAKGKPFTADESLTMWRALPQDKKERRALKSKLIGWKTSKDRTRLTSTGGAPISFARDSEGRVLKEMKGVESVQDNISGRGGNSLRSNDGTNDHVRYSRPELDACA